LRVTVVHDYLTQRGGAERAVLALLHAFPQARLITSIYNRATTFPEFAERRVDQLWTGRVPLFRQDPRRAFPVLATAFSRALVTDADVVVCSSSGWAHGIGATAPKIVYCHNPARWLYQPDDYLPGVPRCVRPVVRGLSSSLKAWDARQARQAVAYVANSSSVRRRIQDAYGVDAQVVHPPAGVDPEGPTEPVRGLQPGYLLHVGRPRRYKNADAVAHAIAAMPDERLVSVGGLPSGPAGGWPARLVGLENVTDAQLRWLYRNSAGLIALGHEDFGITPLEAYAFGKPVVVLRAGGYLDSTIEGVTGVFTDDSSVDSVTAAVRAFRGTPFDSCRIRAHATSFHLDAYADAMREIVYRSLNRVGHGV